ncbi:MAG: putative metal-binding motif-containing protein [Nitrospirae bacterium]|nr:putative metal-binding motif-containing protein [Nitrospirota bacterium]
MKNKSHLIYLSLLVLVFSLFVGGVAEATVPQTINYQGFLTNTAGQPVNGPVTIVFSLYDMDSGGTALWSETHQNVDLIKGVYSVILGNGNPTPVVINLPFDVQYYLGVKVGTDQEMTPRQVLTAVPYAFRALTVPAASITSEQIAPGSITVEKLADMCAVGEVLKKTASGWVCGAPPCIPNVFVNCYSGPANTLNIGSCKSGIRRCSAQGSFGLCEGEILPVSEVCDGLDNDCDGIVDNALNAPAWSRDNDGDGFGNPNDTIVSCTQPAGYVANSRDCNDTLTSVFQTTGMDPIRMVGGIEICGDGFDNNCNGQTDEVSCLAAACNAMEIVSFNCNGNLGCLQYLPPVSGACSNALGTVRTCLEGSHCMEQTGGIAYYCAIQHCRPQWEAAFGAFPPACTDGETLACGSTVGECRQGTQSCAGGQWGACTGSIDPVAEICGDGKDNNCNGVIDEPGAWYFDGDGDGFGDFSQELSQCEQPVGYVDNQFDCVDTDASIHPDALEVCDAIDNNCDGYTDEGCPSCSDLIKNGDETDIDCGGPMCGPSCVPNQSCIIDSDCITWLCGAAGKCTGCLLDSQCASGVCNQLSGFCNPN